MSEAIDLHYVVPEIVNPQVSHEKIFGDHPEATYYIGEVAALGAINDEELWDAAGRLRGDEYVWRRGFLTPDSLDSKGREYDSYDDKSLHYALVKNMGNTAEVVGNLMAVIGESDETKLPLEKDFDLSLDMPKSEIKRFISRDKGIFGHLGSAALIRTATYQLLNRDIDKAYFEIEKVLYDLLGRKGMGIPLNQIAPEQLVQEPGGLRTLYPLEVHVPDLIGSVKEDLNGFPLRTFFESESATGGIGHFNSLLMRDDK